MDESVTTNTAVNSHNTGVSPNNEMKTLQGRLRPYGTLRERSNPKIPEYVVIVNEV